MLMTETDKVLEVIAGRYRVERILGKGGMAIVYLVHDVVTKKPMALKQLLPDDQDAARQKHIAELFEHEFHTLAQLSHPRVVEVYDFGKDETHPYYTMELLDGGDLRELCPLRWKQACAYMYDVCSVLSLLHSRRLVHRDLTPRNVRCTRDQKAKLIDFGAMLPMGPCKQVVGTPAFTAPEVVTLQILDARTDLYSLGATLYYVLTGHLAYPARNFQVLRDSWRSRPRPPSFYSEDIPKELDALVFSLLELDPQGRPANAAEVMERLSAIASLDVREHLLVSQSYLSTPMLAGRDEQVIQVRKKLIRATRGYGSVVLIESDSGMGRSRFLDACVLEGKLLGACVLRADASDAHSGNWGVVQALTNQLLDSLPEETFQAAKPHLSVLGHVLPQLLATAEQAFSLPPAEPLSSEERESDDLTSHQTEGGQRISSGEVRVKRHSWRPPSLAAKANVVLENFESSQMLRPRVQAALRDWIIQVAQQHCLLLAVDDIDRIDEPSAAFLALLANEISTRCVAVVATSEIKSTASSPATIKLLKQVGTTVELNALSLDHTHALLNSVFGDVPNLQILAHTLYNISRGRPGAVMTFAQHLVDRGMIRYTSGAWTLPSRIDTGDLPNSLSAALRSQTDKLSDYALSLAQTLALCPRQSVTIDELQLLTDLSDKAKLVKVLNQLLAMEIFSTDGHHYALSQSGWLSVLIDELSPERSRILNLRLADVFARRGNQACRVARHLFNAGEDERGLDVLIADAEADKQKIDQSSQAYSDFVVSLPKEWREIYEYALAVCRRLNRPKKQSFLLRVFLTRISDHSGLENTSHVTEVVKQLIHDSGLESYHELGDSVEAEKRLWRALELTQEQFNSAPDSDRVLPPEEAIPELAKTLSNVIGIAASSYDYYLLESMPSLEPLAPLSPALGLIDKSIDCTKNIFSANVEKTLRGYQEILQRIAEPDHGGLDDTIHKYIDLGHRYALGIVEATFGSASSLKWADEIESDPLHQVNAWLIRMVYYLRQGDIQQVEQCKQKMEMLQIQNSPSQFYEGSHLYPELMAYATVDDLVRVKQIQEGIATMAQRFMQWEPIVHFARGEYQRIRGDYQSALDEHQKALDLMEPGKHITWPHSVAAYLKTLAEMDRLEEAQAVGEKAFIDAREKVGDLEMVVIGIPLSIVLAMLGEFESALQLFETMVEKNREYEMTGINPGMAYEARATVAIFMKDEVDFRTYAKACAEHFQKSHYAVLAARYEKLLQRARDAGLVISGDLAYTDDALDDASDSAIETMVSEMLTQCQNPGKRARRTLELIVEQSKSSGGFLYSVQTDGLTLKAQSDDRPPPNEMNKMVNDYLMAEVEGYDDVTVTCADLAAPMKSVINWNTHLDKRYFPVLLGHNTEQGYLITGLVVLYTDQDRFYNVPFDTVDALSKFLYRAGDVTGMLTEV